MNVDTVRAIDRHAGVPLCWLFTWLLRIAGLLRPRRKVRPRRVLLMELSEMGSVILADPAMRKLQARLGAELHFAIFRRNAPSLGILNTVPPENVFTIREDSFLTLTRDSLALLWWARRRGIDTVIDLELFSRYTALLTGLSGAANRVGFYRFHNEGLYRGEMLTHRVAYNPFLHIAKNFIALVNALIDDNGEVPYSKTLIGDEEIRLQQVNYPEAERDRLRAMVREDWHDYDPARHRLVLINPNASQLLPQRRWMPDRYATLMRTILERYGDVLVLITGAPEERAEADNLKEQVAHERCINFAGRLKLEELTVLYSIAFLMVTNDSGPGHFSSVTPMPTFILFGPESPRLYGSLGNATPLYAGLACSPCVSAHNHRETPCRDNVCLQAIRPEEVFEAIRPLLDGTASGSGAAG